MKAFRTFYIENGEQLFAYLLRKSGNAALAADLVQETFTRYLSQYRNRELSVALLYTIARNSFYDHVRKERPQADPEELDTLARRRSSRWALVGGRAVNRLLRVLGEPVHAHATLESAIHALRVPA